MDRESCLASVVPGALHVLHRQLLVLRTFESTDGKDAHINVGGKERSHKQVSDRKSVVPIPFSLRSYTSVMQQTQKHKHGKICYTELVLRISV